MCREALDLQAVDGQHWRQLKNTSMPRKETKTSKSLKAKSSSNEVASTPVPKTFTFHSVKGPCFRSIQADGAWGTVNPHGNIHLIFFNERSPVPQEASYDVNPDGTLGNEILSKRIGKTGIMREMEVDVILNLGAAMRVHKWLGDAIEPFLKQNVSQPD